MTPALDCLRHGIDSRVTLKVPTRLTASTACHWSKSISSTEVVGPEMPALFTSTPMPPRVPAAALTNASTGSRRRRRSQ